MRDSLLVRRFLAWGGGWLGFVVSPLTVMNGYVRLTRYSSWSGARQFGARPVLEERPERASGLVEHIYHGRVDRACVKAGLQYQSRL